MPPIARLVKQFREKYGRLPSLYASQGFDTANLCFPRLKKPMSNGRMIFAMPLRAANFNSACGAFKFGKKPPSNPNNYAREVVKEGEIFTNKTLSIALEDHADAYAEQCKM